MEPRTASHRPAAPSNIPSSMSPGIHRGALDQTDAIPSARVELLPEPLPAEPFTLFKQWFDEALSNRTPPNPNAFALGTVNREHRPSVRTVLCKGIDPATGHIVFYTNYRGRKARDLDVNPHAAACFH